MSGGVSARFGFLFSDLIVIKRMLEHLLQARLAQIEGRELPLSPEFCIESSIAPDEDPNWDILEEHPGSPPLIILEEVKSGPLDADDRRAFWRRIRRTAAQVDNRGLFRLKPRLTTNADKPTSHEERWGELPRFASEVSADIPPQPFTSTETLAQEALYCLTHAEEGEESPLFLTVERAREILQSFEFNNGVGANALEDEVEQLISRLSFGLGMKTFCDALVGDFYRRAASEDPTRHRFHAEDIRSSVEALQRLSEVHPEDARLWQVWRDITAPLDEAGSSISELSKLSYQNWYEVQPKVAALLTSSNLRLLALVGRAGLGKTVLLKKLREEGQAGGARTIWLTGFDLSGKTPAQISNALSLGAFVCTSTGTSLKIFIDAVDVLASDAAHLQGVLASLSDVAINNETSIALTTRETVWSSLVGSQESLPRWNAVKLMEWHEERVRALTHTTQRSGISSELLNLLRTPLLLDVFLRAFGTLEPIPDGLQSRHGVLKAYWQRRVTPSDRPESIERLEKLLHCCSEEAAGRSLHIVSGPAIHQLASEGVLIQHQGAWLFRHSLLRDFAMMLWAVRTGGDASGLISRLGEIRSSLTRWGTTRATIEAACDTSLGLPVIPSIEDIVTKMQGDLLMFAAEILGELDDPSIIPLGRILDSIKPMEQASSFVDRLLELAALASNAAWLRWIVSLPSSSRWIDSTGWIGRNFLSCVTNLIEVVWHDRSRNTELSLASEAHGVALRLRNWSAAPKFAPLLAEHDGVLLARLMPLISKHEPSQATLEWLKRHVNQNWWTKRGALQALPLLIVYARQAQKTLEGRDLVELYRVAAGLVESPAGFRRDPCALLWPSEEYQRTRLTLLGHQDREKALHSGLLREAPELFLPVALNMLSGFAVDEKTRERERWKKLLEAEVENSQKYTIKGQELEVLAFKQVLGDDLDTGDALGSLVDDIGYVSSRDERKFILNAIENDLRENIEQATSLVETMYWPAIRNCHSAAVWMLLLELLVSNPQKKTKLLDEFLSSRPLYHLSRAQYWVYQAIRCRWPLLDSSMRAEILCHIKSIARSPAMTGIYGVAPVASAVPVGDRPAWLAPYFELYSLRELDPIPKPPNDYEQVIFEYEALSPEREDAASRGTSAWEKVENWSFRPNPSEPDSLLVALSGLKAALSEDFPSPEVASRRPRIFQVLRELLGGLPYYRLESPLPPELEIGTEEIVRLAEWSLEVIKQCSTQELEESTVPVRVDGTPEKGVFNPWIVTLEFLNVLLSLPPVRDDSSLRRAIFSEIQTRALHLTPTFAWYLFRALSARHWIHQEGLGRELLRQMLHERVRDPGALRLAFRHAWEIGGAERERIFRRWMVEPNFFETENGLNEFAEDLGEFMGQVAFIQNEGEYNEVRVLVEEFLALTPSTGLLAHTENYHRWCIGIAFGAKQSMLGPTMFRRAEIHEEFSSLMTKIWEGIVGQSNDGWDSRFVMFMLHPLQALVEEGMENRQKTVVRFWERLESLAKRIAAEGREPDVFSLVWGIDKEGLVNVLGAGRLVGLVEILHQRATQMGVRLKEPPRSPGVGWMYVYQYVAEMVGSMALASDSTEDMRNRLHEVLQAWTGLGIPKAGEMARAVRSISR